MRPESSSESVTAVRAGRSAAMWDRQVAVQRRRAALHRHAVAYAFLLPSLIFFVVFLVVPVAWVARQSLQQGGVLGPATWVGLDNWKQAVGDTGFRNGMGNTLLLAGVVVPPIFVLAMSLALLLRETRGRASILRAAVYFPSLTPVVVAGLTWFFMIHPDFGLFNVGNRALGLDPLNFRGEETLAVLMIASLEIWRAVGFWALFLLAALIAVPADLYAAARVDGASTLRRFWHVTLPTIRPQLAVAVLLSTLSALQIFDSVFILTGGGPAGATETAVTYIYRSIFESANPGYGAVLSLILVAVIIAVTGVLARLLSSGSPQSPR
jgi:multiple sugar transport system permease protein